MAARGPLTFWVCAAILLLCLVLLASMKPVVARPLTRPLADIPARLGIWQGEDRAFSDAVNAVLQADDSLLRRHVGPDGSVVWAYVAFWTRQADGMSAHSPKLCYSGAGWTSLQENIVTVPLRGQEPAAIQVNAVLFQKGGLKELVLYWYQTGRHVVASEYFGKFHLVYNSLWHRRSDVAFVRLSTEVTDGDTSGAFLRLQDLARKLFPELDARLPQ
jgi:EpsI family protein